MSDLTFGITPALSSTTYIAKENYLFREQGLKIDFREFLTGRKAMRALQKGWVDIANVIDVNIASIALEKKQKIKLLACTQIREDGQILAREDKSIKCPSDLIGKKLGYMPYTSSHSFIEYFVKHHSLSLDKVELIPVRTDQMEKELLMGNIDACSMWQPYATHIRLAAARENINITTFKNDGFFEFYVLLAATEKAIKKNNAEINTILEILNNASSFIDKNPEESSKILANVMNMDINIFKQIQKDTTYNITTIPDNFWKQVELQLKWLSPDNSIDYEKYIDSLTSL